MNRRPAILRLLAIAAVAVASFSLSTVDAQAGVPGNSYSVTVMPDNFPFTFDDCYHFSEPTFTFFFVSLGNFNSDGGLVGTYASYEFGGISYWTADTLSDTLPVSLEGFLFGNAISGTGDADADQGGIGTFTFEGTLGCIFDSLMGEGGAAGGGTSSPYQVD